MDQYHSRMPEGRECLRGSGDCCRAPEGLGISGRLVGGELGASCIWVERVKIDLG